MKGTKENPMCGFSSVVVFILDKLYTKDYLCINVLDNVSIREGVKSFSKWPTIPQLYIDGEFVGGADIVREMYNSGELKKILEKC